MFNFKLTVTRIGKKPSFHYFSKRTDNEAKGEAMKHLPPHLNRTPWKIMSEHPYRRRKASDYCVAVLETI